MTKMKCGAGLMLCAASAALFASQTRIWSQGDYTEFEKGTIKNLSVRSDGLLSLGPHSRELMDTSSAYLWALAQDSKGNLYAGGGSGAKLFRIPPDGKGKVFYQSEERHDRWIVICCDNSSRSVATVWVDQCRTTGMWMEEW